MKRGELIELLKSEAKAARYFARIDTDRGVASGLDKAVDIAKRLDEAKAMTWQDEPSGTGWHWVCGERIEPTWIVDDMLGGWTCVFGPYSGPLNGRRVCPIPAPPVLPKRGDA